jgi:isocitrate dehydrogenase
MTSKSLFSQAAPERDRVAVAAGDGIGPEISAGVEQILRAAEVGIELVPVELGLPLYERGVSSGIDAAGWNTLGTCAALLKGPMTTPQGKGMKSLNVTLRKTLGLYANIRPCLSFAPAVHSSVNNIDIIVVRENEEDLYAGIEHRQTDDVYQCLKLMSRSGSERLIRAAFALAQSQGRKQLTCVTKDNIMKLTDGMFHDVFDLVAQEFPQLRTQHMIVDIAAARLATRPQSFDVIVTPNLYGDILSDIAAEVTGSVGLCGSSNVGERFAMFEAVHGSAPDIAGRGIANPSGLLQAAVMMLLHMNHTDAARRVHNAWLCTLEDGVHTADIYDKSVSRRRASTREFTDAVIERLGRSPHVLPQLVTERSALPITPPPAQRPRQHKTQVGIDVFFDATTLHTALDPLVWAEKLQAASQASSLQLNMLTNRGVKVWPDGHKDTFLVDQFRGRFQREDFGTITPDDVMNLLRDLHAATLHPVKTEGLYAFDGKPAFSVGQGQ